MRVRAEVKDQSLRHLTCEHEARQLLWRLGSLRTRVRTIVTRRQSDAGRVWELGLRLRLTAKREGLMDQNSADQNTRSAQSLLVARHVGFAHAGGGRPRRP